MGSSDLTIAILAVAGQALPPAFQLVSLDIEREVNRIPTAILEFSFVGSRLEQEDLWTGGPFAPAAEVSVSLRKADAEVKVFTGLVARVAARVRNGAPVLEVVLKDKAVRLAGLRRNRIFADQTDAGAIGKVVSEAGLTMGDAPDPGPVHHAMVQYDAADWDFILSRADAQGLAVVAAGGELALKPLTVGEATREFSFALGTIGDADFELDLTRQCSAISGVAWDPAQATPAEPGKAAEFALSQGGDAAGAADALSLGEERLVHMVPMPAPEAENWAAARLARTRLALVRGSVSVGCIPDLALLEVAKLEGLGERFSGKALITGFRHRMDSGGYSTVIQFGLPADPFGRTPGIAEPPAKGLLPPITGLHLGTVTKAEADDEGRVEIQVPAMQEAGQPQTLLARIAKPDAGNGRGFCFFPEVDDEVVVGFLGDDPRHPIVLGRLHGLKNPPPEGFADAKTKGLVTTSGVKITIQEKDNPSIVIETKAGRKLTLDDDGGLVSLADADGNKIEFGSNGVTIVSAKDLKIQASGAITLKGASVDMN